MAAWRISGPSPPAVRFSKGELLALKPAGTTPQRFDTYFEPQILLGRPQGTRDPGGMEGEGMAILWIIVDSAHTNRHAY